jgi:copper chaperone CopZ
MSSHRKIRVELTKIDTREEVDALERNLKQLSGLTVHTLGLSEVELSYDQHEVDEQLIRQAVEEAGGAVRSITREE